MAGRYSNNLKNTSDYVNDLLNEYIKVPRTAFDNTSRIILDVTPFAIIPFDIFEMLPNSDAYLKYNLQMISKNPTIKRLLSGMNVEIRTYKVNYNDCWEGWNNFITKGRSGKVVKSIPYIDWSLGDSSSSTCLPYNPYFTLGIAPSVFIAKNETSYPTKRWSFESNSKVGNTVNAQYSIEPNGLTGITTIAQLQASTAMRVSALPGVFYNKIVKEMIPSNLLQDNPHWFPENENHDQILPYSAQGAVTTSDYDNPNANMSAVFSFTGATYDNVLNPSSENDGNGNYFSYPWLNVIQYAERKGDYFNTGSPFPDLIRGDIPTLDILNANIDFSNVVGSDINGGRPLGISADGKIGGLRPSLDGNNLINLYLTPSLLGGTDNITSQDSNAILAASGVNSYDVLKALNKATISGINFSMSQWRYLATMTVLRERLALTDGSYNELIKAMFGHNPKWHMHSPTYCGGFSQPIVFSEVVNTTESNNAPLGDTAGRAVTAGSSGEIHVHSDDYGMFMSVLIIHPDEYYSQGVDKMWSRLENPEQYLPILNNLSPDSTKNKELYVSGNNTDDEDVFNYQERFAFYKSRRNRISGLLAMPISLIGDVGAYVINRLFGSTPNFNSEFTRGNMSSNEKSVFASTSQAEFCAVIGSQFKYVGPIPRDSRPSNMGISY